MQLDHQLINSHPFFVFGTFSNCAYCGQPSTCKDHVIPFKFFSHQKRTSSNERIGPNVYACTNCNGKLSDKIFKTFEDRCRFMSNKLYIKAHKTAPEWSDDEIAELDNSLRAHVLFKRQIRNELLARSKWFGTNLFYLNLENLLTEETIIPESDKFNQQYHDFFESTIHHVKDCIRIREISERAQKDDNR